MAAQEPKGRVVTFEITPELAEIIDGIKALCGFTSDSEFYSRAGTALRIHVEAALLGRTVQMFDPNNSSEKYTITLPFRVNQ